MQKKINNINPSKINGFIENIKKYKKHCIFKERAISYLIHNCDIDDVSEILKLFNLLDKKNNGKILYIEFYEQLCEISGEKITDEEGRKIFLNLDTNKNNYLEQEEFVKAALDKKIFLTEKMLKLSFNFFDINNSGLITIYRRYKVIV